MKKKLTNNIGLKILSVVFAFLLWLIVVSVDDPVTVKTFSMIPVELTNEQVITSQGSVYEVVDNSDVVSISVTAKRSVLDTLSRDNFKAFADMSRLDGTMIPIEVKATKYADRIDNITLRNKNVKIAIEGLLARQFNIKVRTSGDISQGCIIGNMYTDKNVVKVSGPESIVSQIDSAVVDVDVSGMTSDISTAENIVLYDAQNKEISQNELTLSRESVNVTVEIWNTKEIPINFSYTGVPAVGYGTTGALASSLPSLTVTGRKSALDAVSSISIPASVVDITDARGPVEVQVDVSRYLPEGIIVIPGEAGTIATVTVEVQQLNAKNVEVPTSNITIVNVPEEMEASIGGVGEVIAVGVRGMGAAFDNINPLEITGIVDAALIAKPEDAETLPEGVYDAEVVFAYPLGIIAGEEKVTVKVILKVKGVE